MPLSIFMVLIWFILAHRAEAVPPRYHWPLAWGLIATGIPLLGMLTMQFGPIAGLVCLGLGACLFRWPLLAGAKSAEQSLIGQER